LGDDFFTDIVSVDCLRGIDQVGDELSDRDVAVLNDMPMLKAAFLRQVKISDEGFAHISHLRHLETLILGNTSISNRGAMHLVHLCELREVSLDRCTIAKGAFAHLSKLKKLERVLLRRTEVDECSVAAFHKQLPICPILEEIPGFSNPPRYRPYSPRKLMQCSPFRASFTWSTTSASLCRRSAGKRRGTRRHHEPARRR
jgi:hypothetical protein